MGVYFSATGIVTGLLQVGPAGIPALIRPLCTVYTPKPDKKKHRVNIGGSAGLEQQALSQAVADALARAAERLHEQKTTGAGQAAEPGQADDRGESAESEAPMPPAPRPDLSS